MVTLDDINDLTVVLALLYVLFPSFFMLCVFGIIGSYL